MEGNDFVEVFTAPDGLTLEIVTDYILGLVNQGFIFQGARIDSDSDKDTWQTFPGGARYYEDDYATFIKMLRSEMLQEESGVGISFSGQMDGVLLRNKTDAPSGSVKHRFGAE